MGNWPTSQTHPLPTPQISNLPPPAYNQGYPSKSMANMSAIAPPRLEDYPCPRLVQLNLILDEDACNFGAKYSYIMG